jgi:hypothetical protein
MFIYRQGSVKFTEPNYDFPTSELDNYRMESVTAAGPIRHLAPVLQMSETQPHWERPTPTLGGNSPEWLPR